ncbi:hypothetical protein H671_21091 [Cricetulus griseus]|nr:hypothetical protein H671_21091 [Cricetulus griseus]
MFSFQSKQEFSWVISCLRCKSSSTVISGCPQKGQELTPPDTGAFKEWIRKGLIKAFRKISPLPAVPQINLSSEGQI